MLPCRSDPGTAAPPLPPHSSRRQDCTGASPAAGCSWGAFADLAEKLSTAVCPPKPCASQSSMMFTAQSWAGGAGSPLHCGLGGLSSPWRAQGCEDPCKAWEFLSAEGSVCWDALKCCRLWDAFYGIGITSQGSARKECWGKEPFLNRCYSCPAMMSGLLFQMYEEVQSLSVYQSVSFGEGGGGCFYHSSPGRCPESSI